ncbi:pilus assembly protein TadG-related protein [Bradyrhizobium sp. cir1]|uniref:pilus assembly protein TadG-related protein n=1 Tax=Bradyrhizobium sp. cir1 TaxID=1445730 RepID=UPI001AEDB20A|nr:pilus assembly protein TadG-related protein [Bradyrhizobium sp. cir1]
MLRCRRGSVAFATVIALVPLIGVVALGAEAGSWYVTKQHAQTAADAAAFSGGLTLACSISGSSNCDTAQDYVYRGKEFAAQNKFCNTGDTVFTCASSLAADTTQTVLIDQGAYDAVTGAWTSSTSGTFVRASVSQHQPAYLAAVLGLSTVDIGAQAIVQIQNPKNLCGLGLNSSGTSLTIGGSSIITGTGCALMSDSAVKYNSTPTFVGSDWAVDAVAGCKASSGHCTISVPYNYNMLPVVNPLKVLDTETFNSRTGNTPPPQGSDPRCNSKGKCYLLTPNSSAGAYKDITVNNNDTLIFTASGTYFFYNASIKINSGTVIGTGVTLVLLGTSSLSIGSGATVNLSAPATNTFSSDLNGVLIDDQSSAAVSITGGGTVALSGAMYFPKADVTYGGTVQGASTCAEVIANTLTINGNVYLSSTGCGSNTITSTQIVALVH